MTPEQKLPDLLRREAVAPRRFNPRSATPFVNKSVSEETRRAYRRTVADFFQFVGGKQPSEVVPNDVLRWRDHLRAGRKRPATVSFKLSVIRSFFEYFEGCWDDTPQPGLDEASASTGVAHRAIGASTHCKGSPAPALGARPEQAGGG